MLLATKDSLILEVSEWDCYWGIGMNVETLKQSLKRDFKFPGKNKLGFTLMRLRDNLKSNYPWKTSPKVIRKNQSVFSGGGIINFYFDGVRYTY